MSESFDAVRSALDAAQAEYIEFVEEDLAEDAAFRAELALKDARIVDLERQLADEGPPPPPPPPPPLDKTEFGACLLTNEAGVLARFGPKASVRRFYTPTQGMTVPNVPAGCSFFHVSWKPATQPTRAQLIAACRPLRKGDGVTLHHEIDVKHKKGSVSASELSRILGMQSQFHADIVALRQAGDIPAVETWLVHGGWRYSGGNESPDPYMADADVLGPDLDGANTRITQSFYLDWAATVFMSNITRVANRDFDGRWGAPEYGERLINSDDEQATGTVGAKRLTAVKLQVPKLVANGAESVLWFDNESSADWEGYPLTAVELPYWRELCATNV